MRITNKMLSNNFLSDMRRNLNNMQTLQTQLTSGKEFRKPSDNPFAVARSMQMHTEIDKNKQYNKNITDTINWLDVTDTALGQMGSVFQNIREKLVSAGNAAYGSDERQKIKDEINQRVAQVGQILNTSFDGEYIFSGTRGTTKPVTSTTGANGNIKLDFVDAEGKVIPTADDPLKKPDDPLNLKRKIEVSQGVTIDYNVNATEVVKYGDGAGDDIRVLLNKIVNHLDGKNDDGTALDSTANSKLLNDDLSQIDKAMSNLLKVRSEVGAKSNRMENAKDQNEENNFSMTEILSKSEDIDITEKTMDYATMQTIYMASLQTSAKVLQPTIMDYLR